MTCVFFFAEMIWNKKFYAICYMSKRMNPLKKFACCDSLQVFRHCIIVMRISCYRLLGTLIFLAYCSLVFIFAKRIFFHSIPNSFLVFAFFFVAQEKKSSKIAFFFIAMKKNGFFFPIVKKNGFFFPIRKIFP